MGASLIARNLTKSYPSLNVLENWNLNITPSERVVLLGPSGSGKTTFLKLLAGLEKPTQGEILVESRRIGFVFQEARLIPWKSVKDNLLFVNENGNVEEILSTLRLQDFSAYFPAQLSGGMKQRVNLARALIVEPDLLILDEAFASVDLKVKLAIMDDILEEWTRRKFTIIAVTHDLKEALYLADRILIMSHRPAGIIKDFHVKLEHNRNFSSPELLYLEAQLLEIVTATV